MRHRAAPRRHCPTWSYGGRRQGSAEQTALFLIYGFAKNYVLLYEDQAVTADFSNAAKTQLLTYMQQLNAALETQDKALILERLNQVTQDYMLSSRVF